MNCNSNRFCEMRRSIDGPAWRSQLAQSLAASPKASWQEVSDELVHQLAGFYQLLVADRTDGRQTTKQYPVIATAKSLWENPEIRKQFIILTLGDCDHDLIAKRLQIDLKTLKTMEALFFDIRNSREATGWINAHVILPESKAGHIDLAIKYRHAYWGGAKVAEWTLETGKGLLGDSVQQIAEQEQRLQMKCLAALEMPLTNSKETLQFLRISLNHQHRLKRLEFEKEQFRGRAEHEIRKCGLAERRQRNAERQLEQRIVVAQRKQERKLIKEERERLSAIQESIQQQRQYSEHLQRIVRANQSPLGSLTWKKSTSTVSSMRTTNTPQDEQMSDAA